MEELFQSSSESDQESEMVKESGIGLSLEECESNFGSCNLVGVEDTWRPGPQPAPNDFNVGAVPRKFTQSSSSSTSTVPVSPLQGVYMDSASSGADASRVEVGRSYNTGNYRSRDGLLFPPTSPVLTSVISSTLFASSFSSLRFCCLVFTKFIDLKVFAKCLLLKQTK